MNITIPLLQKVFRFVNFIDYLPKQIVLLTTTSAIFRECLVNFNIIQELFRSAHEERQLFTNAWRNHLSPPPDVEMKLRGYKFFYFQFIMQICIDPKYGHALSWVIASLIALPEMHQLFVMDICERLGPYERKHASMFDGACFKMNSEIVTAILDFAIDKFQKIAKGEEQPSPAIFEKIPSLFPSQYFQSPQYQSSSSVMKPLEVIIIDRVSQATFNGFAECDIDFARSHFDKLRELASAFYCALNSSTTTLSQDESTDFFTRYHGTAEEDDEHSNTSIDQHPRQKNVVYLVQKQFKSFSPKIPQHLFRFWCYLIFSTELSEQNWLLNTICCSNFFPECIDFFFNLIEEVHGDGDEFPLLPYCLKMKDPLNYLSLLKDCAVNNPSLTVFEKVLDFCDKYGATDDDIVTPCCQISFLEYFMMSPNAETSFDQFMNVFKKLLERHLRLLGEGTQLKDFWNKTKCSLLASCSARKQQKLFHYLWTRLEEETGGEMEQFYSEEDNEGRLLLGAYGFNGCTSSECDMLHTLLMSARRQGILKNVLHLRAPNGCYRTALITTAGKYLGCDEVIESVMLILAQFDNDEECRRYIHERDGQLRNGRDAVDWSNCEVAYEIATFLQDSNAWKKSVVWYETDFLKRTFQH